MLTVRENGHSYMLRLEGKPNKDDILIVLGMAIEKRDAGFGCNECVYCSTDCIDEYSSNCWDYCEHPDPKKCRRGNLKTFPFKNSPKDCFSIEPWASPFINLAISYEGDLWPNDCACRRAALRLWRATDSCGIPRLKPENESKAKKAWSKFKERTGYNEKTTDL